MRSVVCRVRYKSPKVLFISKTILQIIDGFNEFSLLHSVIAENSQAGYKIIFENLHTKTI